MARVHCLIEAALVLLRAATVQHNERKCGGAQTIENKTQQNGFAVCAEKPDVW